MKTFSVTVILFSKILSFAHSNLGERRTINVELGQSVRISYLSKSPNESIEFCTWTPPPNSKNKAKPFISRHPVSECGIDLDKIGVGDFGNWSYIAILQKSSSSESSGQEPLLVEGFLTVELVAPTITILDSHLSKNGLWIMEAKNGTLDLTEQETTVTCCYNEVSSSRNHARLHFYFDALKLITYQELFKNHRFCIQLNAKFDWKNNFKVIECRTPESESVSAKLNINYSPRLILNGEPVNCNFRTLLFNVKESKANVRPIKFYSNPLAKIKWKEIVPSLTDRKVPYSQVVELNATKFLTNLSQITPNLQETTIRLTNTSEVFSDEWSPLQLLLTLDNSVGKCQITVKLTNNSDPWDDQERSQPTTSVPTNSFVDLHIKDPVILDRKFRFYEGNWLQTNCCIAIHPDMSLIFYVDNTPIAKESQTVRRVNATQICVRLHLKLNWTHNEKLLRCRGSLRQSLFEHEDSILLSVMHKPVLTVVEPLKSTGGSMEQHLLTVSIASNPIPTGIWELKTSRNETCFTGLGEINLTTKGRYNASLKMDTEILGLCQPYPINILLQVSNDLGHAEVKFKWGVYSQSRGNPIILNMFPIKVSYILLTLLSKFTILQN